MLPLTNGYYLSELMTSEEWHAGVLMAERYFRFLQFFTDGFWVWSDRSDCNFDFPGFVESLDLAKMCGDPKAIWPPAAVGGGHLFEFGTFQADGNEIVLSFYSPLSQSTLEFRAYVVDEGRELRAFETRLRWQSTSSP